MITDSFTQIDKMVAIRFLRKALRVSLVQCKRITDYLERSPDGICLEKMGDFIELYGTNDIIFYEDGIYQKLQ